MNKKKVLIIEDNEEHLIALQDYLEGYGFEIYGANSVAEARRLAELHWEELDVAVLDMSLELDTESMGITGADIGLEFRKKKKTFPPELLIYSAYERIDYYRLAISLGAAAYLSKNHNNILDVAQHAGVLALRRALNGQNPKTAAEVARVAARSKTRLEAIRTFCREVLKPEFAACLYAPFVFLLTEGDTTENCADNAGLPLGSNAFYQTLQALVHGKANSIEPFIFEAREMEAPSDEETALLQERLDNAAFLPLSLSNNLRLSVGILQPEDDMIDARALCNLLAHYIQPSVLENIMNIWSQWTRHRATRTSTARLCLSVGQVIKDTLQRAELERLEELADDMNDTGQLLIQLENADWPAKREALSIKDIVAATWELIADSGEKPAARLEIQGDCKVQAQRGDLEIIFSRLLQWFANRNSATPMNAEPLISIYLETTAGGATMTFQDNSRRLPEGLREHMFAPFTQAISTPFPRVQSPQLEEGEGASKTLREYQDAGRYLPLYLAKILVEGRYQGSLEDRSDEIEGNGYGNRIVMSFPVTDEVDGIGSSRL